jgi:hypothetical protein
MLSLLSNFLKSPLTRGSFIRFISSFVLSSGTAIGVIYINYYNYWEGTIYRVQTVDFNILSNFLPTKLSLYLSRPRLSKNEIESLQQALDSNYGLFGIIVTDCKTDAPRCPGQKMLYTSKSKVVNLPDGKQRLTSQGSFSPSWLKPFKEQDFSESLLTEAPFVLLRNSVPLEQEWKFETPQAHEKKFLKAQNTGNIIGRAYFIRANKPSFGNEIDRWIQNIPNSIPNSANTTRASSRNLIYNSIGLTAIISGLLVFTLMEFAYYRARLARKNEEAAITDSQIAIEARQQAEQAALVARGRAERAEEQRQQAERAALVAESRAERAEQQWRNAENAARAAEVRVEQAEEAAFIAEVRAEQAAQQKEEAERAALIAVQQRAQAEEAARAAEARAEQAAQQREEAERAALIAVQQRAEAENAALAVEARAEQAEQQREEAERAALIAVQQRAEAEEAARAARDRATQAEEVALAAEDRAAQAEELYFSELEEQDNWLPLPQPLIDWDTISQLQKFFREVNSNSIFNRDIHSYLQIHTQLEELIEHHDDNHVNLNDLGKSIYKTLQQRHGTLPQTEWPEPSNLQPAEKNGLSSLAHRRPRGWRQCVRRLCEIECVTRISYDEAAYSGSRVRVLDGQTGTISVLYGSVDLGLPLRVETTARTQEQADLVVEFIERRVI